MPTAHIHGAAMMVKREVIEKVGGMPEDFFLYYEELDWSDQIRSAGFQVFFEPNAKIYHKESVSVGKSSNLHLAKVPIDRTRKYTATICYISYCLPAYSSLWVFKHHHLYQ